MWFGATTRLEVDGTCVRVATDSRFVCDWINGHFRGELDGIARETLGERARVDLRVAPDLFGAPAPRSHDAQASPPPGPRRRAAARRPALRRLEDFVVGPCNSLAFAAGERIADGRQRGGSPLFVHGACGVGKTHLLQGITARSARRRGAEPQRVRYLTAEQFTNEYINAVRLKTLDGFRRRMRGMELLAVDDVHFFTNKTSTQNEFLHTTDAIDHAGGCVVLAADEHPMRLGFNQALSSRFVAGMVAEIDRPDRETRLDLARALAAARHVVLSETAARCIADRCCGSVRDLEGAVNKLAALRLVSCGDGEIGQLLVDRLFRDPGWRPRTPLRIETVVDVVCRRLNVERADLLGAGRSRRAVAARGLVAYLARQMTTLSYPEIAHALGRKHHSTVHTAVKRVERQLAEHREVGDGRTITLAALVDQLRHEILKSSR